jgi:type I restriction enzyme S subunit
MAFKPTDWVKQGLPIIRIQNLNRPDAEFNYCDSVVDRKFIVQTGELLFAWSGTPGTSFGAHIWSGPTAVLNQHIFRVLFDEACIDKNFFRCAINAKLDELIGKAHGGAGLAHVTKGRFEDTKIELPPLAEQRPHRREAGRSDCPSRPSAGGGESDHISCNQTTRMRFGKRIF